jgi:hypothetical protein
MKGEIRMGKTAKVSPADVRSIANKRIATAKDAVAAALANFEGTADGEHGFGNFDAGSELAALHASVKSVFSETVSGVTTDLSSYHHNLIAGANAWEDSDQASANHSRALTERLSAAGRQPLATKQNYLDSRTRQGEKLAPGQTLSEHAKDPLPDAGGDQHPAAQTEAALQHGPAREGKEF